MIRRLLDALAWRGPARWSNDAELDACISRHPAGKSIPPGK